MKISMSELNRAIASAAPQEGERWDPNPIARSIAEFIKAEADRERLDQEAWEQGRKDFDLRFVGSDVAFGNASALEAKHAAVTAEHRRLVEDKIAANKALVATIGQSVVGLGAGAFAGQPLPVLVSGGMGIAKLIAEALNE